MWLENMGRLNWEPPQYAALCSYHFEDHILDFQNCKWRLQKESIPTKFENEPVTEGPELTNLVQLKPNSCPLTIQESSTTVQSSFNVPVTYFEAGLLCTPKSLYVAASNGYLLTFVMAFMYIAMPLIARVSSCLLAHVSVNVWILKGMEVFYCMPPPLNVAIVLSRVANADLPASIATTFVSHFGGLVLSPSLVYFMLGASTPPLAGVNLQEIIYCALLPFIVGLTLQTFISKFISYSGVKTSWIPLGLLLITAYHWFCDAVTADSSAIQAVDVLLCVLIACLGQMMITGLCWILCSRWLSKKVLLAALFTSTHKSVGLGGWILRGAYHGSAHGSAINSPMLILPVAQLLLGSLLACSVGP